MKTQTIRLIDVFALGPFMMYFAYQAKSMSDYERVALGLAGLLTITYNCNNYVMAEREQIEG